MRRSVVLIIMACFVAWLGIKGYMFVKNKYYFRDIKGPTMTSVMPTRKATAYQIYHQGSNSRLAILLTDSNSRWLDLVHGLRAIGVPFMITTDIQEALQHKVVMIYPVLSSKTLSYAAIQTLAQFPLQGGTLIAQDIFAKRLFSVFGFTQVKPATKSNTQMRFQPGFALTAALTDPNERVIKIGNGVDEYVGGYAYELAATDKPLASYEDGSVAMTQKIYPNNGKAYALGIDIGELLSIGYDNREEHMARSYVNHYEPTIDVMLRIIKKIYREGQHDAVTLASAPNGKAASVLLTHDIYFAKGSKNAVKFAELEHARGISATYFVQTKYVSDYDDDDFFNIFTIPYLKKIAALNMEIASNSVSRSRQFREFPIGNGKEQYPSYVPVVKNKSTTIDGTIFGELRVSKFLLEYVVPSNTVTAFRPGYFSDPPALPETLVATGYQHSSSVTANNSLTHLPFQLNYNRDYDKDPSMELPVYEFPVTIEDSKGPALLDRLPQALDLFHKLSRYGGIYVVLIAPDNLKQKLQFETELLRKIGSAAWYGSLREFGNWWAARDQIGLDVATANDTATVTIYAPLTIAGLTLQLPNNFAYLSSVPANLSITQSTQHLVIAQLKGQATLRFKVKTQLLQSIVPEISVVFSSH